MNFFEVRRARVRPEYAELYPEIVPGVWMSAKKAAQVVRRSRKSGRSEAPGTRVLPDLHFEFRGGSRGRQYLTGLWTQRDVVLMP